MLKLFIYSLVLHTVLAIPSLIWPEGTLKYNESQECFNVFNTSALLNICTYDKSLCMCNMQNIRNSSNIGVFSTGGVRSFPIAYWSFKKYVLDVNQAQVVYIFQGFNSTKLLHQIALEIALTSGMAVIAHNKELWESLNSYAVNRNRPQQQRFKILDEIQSKKTRGGIIDMWTNVHIGYILLKRISILYKKHYKLVMKTRPDVVYFTPLNMKHAMNDWKHNKLITPYLDHYDINRHVYRQSLFNEKSPEILPPDQNQTGVHLTLHHILPIISPGCDTFGGISDKLFFGPMDYIEIFSNVEILKNFFTMNITYINQYKVGASEILSAFNEWSPSHGLEKLMKSIALWYHIPIAFLPVKGNDGFVYAKLKNDNFNDYCLGKYFPWWGERICLINSGRHNQLRNHSIYDIGAPLQHACHQIVLNYSSI